MANEIKIESVETQIARHTVRALLGAGYAITVDCGDGIEIAESRDETAILRALSATDQDYLLVGGRSWVRLIWGNGADLISDYTTDLDPVLEPVFHAIRAL